MSKCPYTFPHKSRKAMLAYLSEHDSYVPMNTWNGGFVLSWNIKVYRIDETGHNKGEPADYEIQSRFDDAWNEYVSNNSEIFWEACNAALSTYVEKEWTNYPGIEQGEWQFSVNGRSGGHLILTEAPGWLPAPHAWRMFSMIWNNNGHYQDWLKSLDTATLKQFYRAIRVLDHDLRREACEAEVSYHIAFFRSQWEEEQIAAENCANTKLENSRLDMYS